MIREKEVLDMRVATLETDLRAVQSDALKQRAAAVDSEARIKVQHETIMALQAQVRAKGAARLGGRARGTATTTWQCTGGL